MPVKRKGSPTPEGMASRTEAAELLGISTVALQALVRRGVLTPTFFGKKNPFFSLRAITSLAELRKKKIDFTDVAAIATQAYVTAGLATQAVEDLYLFLGQRRPELSITEDAIVAMYVEAQDGLETDVPITPQLLRRWGDALYGIDERYLKLVQQYTASDEPWHVLLRYGQKLMEDTDILLFHVNPDLAVAYRYLRAAVGNLRNVSYFFCRQVYGISVAGRVFTNERDVTESVIRLCYSH